MKTYYTCICLLMGGLLFGQVNPPDFLCVTNDSLRWENVANNCGPYLGTQLFRATNMAGPYSLLTEINDENETVFFDNNPGGEQRFYYLQYNYDCPGQPVFTSDTLDNRIPIGVQVQSVSIEGDDIRVNWLPSPSPEVNRYIIYRREATGFQPIDTVLSGVLTYVDQGQAALDPEQTYAVTSLDACNNNSLFGAQVNTLVPDLSGGNGCESEITLTIAPFAQTNMLPISALALLVSRDGCMTFEEVETFAPTATTFIYDQANDGEALCFVLEGIAANGNGRARSAALMVDVSILQPIRTFPLLSASYDPTGNLSYIFNWDASALATALELNLIQLETGANMPGQIDFASLSDGQNTLTISADQSGRGPHELFLTADDQCDNNVITNRVSTTWLEVTAESGSNQLSWTAYDVEINGPVVYQLLRTDGNGNTETIFSGADLNFLDRVDPNDEGGFRLCYQVLVSYEIDGQVLTATSNQVCVEQIPGIYLPNAFSPVASQVINREFCPFFARIPTGEYQLDVWDRWGGHVFTSQSPEFCWDGTDSGRPASSGVYLYRLQLDLGGRRVEQTGDVTLIR